MLASAFFTYLYILRSKFKLQRLYSNSSTAYSLLLCYTPPCSWRAQRSQGTAARQGEPGATRTHVRLLVEQELVTPWGTRKAREEDAAQCHSLLGSCFSQGCKLSVLSPSSSSGCSGTTFSIPGFFQFSSDAQAEALARDSRVMYSHGQQ